MAQNDCNLTHKFFIPFCGSQLASGQLQQTNVQILFETNCHSADEAVYRDSEVLATGNEVFTPACLSAWPASTNLCGLQVRLLDQLTASPW